MGNNVLKIICYLCFFLLIERRKLGSFQEYKQIKPLIEDDNWFLIRHIVLKFIEIFQDI